MNSLPPVKMVLITGGVISGVGKGIISSSIGVLLKSHGFRVSVIKIDPYINLDAGTFSPFEHGEVFVLGDGGEVDVDLGNYERFLDVRLSRDNNITTGKIYKHVIEKERKGDFLGKTVQTIPHVTGAILDWVQRIAAIPVDGSNERPDVCIIELGGTIGDIEGMPYIAAFERFQRPAYRDYLMTVHVSLVLDPKSTGEPKTKPMQNSIRNLRMSGLIPDLLVCRSEKSLSNALRQKIASFGLVDPEQVIGVHDLSNMYKVPLLLQKQNALELIINRLRLSIPTKPPESPFPSLSQWTNLADLCDRYTTEVRVAIVGKYVKVVDAYASVNRALHHAAVFVERKLIIDYIDAEELLESKDSINNSSEAWEKLMNVDAIVVPGGFGDRGIEGKVEACRYAREKKIPFLGICLGMQCAVIEFARNVCHIPNANSAEFSKCIPKVEQVVIEMPEYDTREKGAGGSMRLGLRESLFLTDYCMLSKLYGSKKFTERHRHRYEINPEIVPKLSDKGMLFVGMGVDKNWSPSEANLEKEDIEEVGVIDRKQELLHIIEQHCQRAKNSLDAVAVRMEVFELEEHPYFVGVQFHPEFLSHPLKPRPPFLGLLLAATGQLESFLDTAAITSTAKSTERNSLCSLLEEFQAHGFINETVKAD